MLDLPERLWLDTNIPGPPSGSFQALAKPREAADRAY